jgi:hypothetical protein
MPKLHHVLKARRSFPSDGIQKGDEYWWYAIPFKPPTRSLIKPRRSEVASTEGLSIICRAIEALEDSTATSLSAAITKDVKPAIAKAIRMYTKSRENSLEHFPRGSRSSRRCDHMIEGLTLALQHCEVALYAADHYSTALYKYSVGGDDLAYPENRPDQYRFNAQGLSLQAKVQTIVDLIDLSFIESNL